MRDKIVKFLIFAVHIVRYGGSHGKLNFPEETSFIPVGQGLGAATLAISQTKPIGQEPQFNSDFMISDEEKSDSEEESDERWIPSGGARLGSPTKKRKLNPRRTIRKITSEIKVKKENENEEDEDDAHIFFEQTLTQMNASRQRIIENVPILILAFMSCVATIIMKIAEHRREKQCHRIRNASFSAKICWSNVAKCLYFSFKKLKHRDAHVKWFIRHTFFMGLSKNRGVFFLSMLQ